MRNAATTAFLTALLIAPSTLGQVSQTLPTGFLSNASNSTFDIPFNTTADQLVMFVYDAAQFQATGPIVISQIYVRPHFGWAGSASGGSFPDVTITIGKTVGGGSGVASPSVNLASNFAPGSGQVIHSGSWAPGPLTNVSPAANWLSLGMTCGGGYLYDPTSGQDFILQIRKCGTTQVMGVGLDMEFGVTANVIRGDTSSCNGTCVCTGGYAVPTLRIDFAPYTSPAPSNDCCSSPIFLHEGVNPTSGYFTNTTATDSPGFVTPCGTGGDPGHRDVFFTWTSGPCSGSVTMDTCNPPSAVPGTNTDTQLTVYPQSACNSLTPPAPIACNDDAGPLCPTSPFSARVTFNTTPTTTYPIRVASHGAGTGSFYLNVRAHTASVANVGSSCPRASVALTGGVPVLGSTIAIAMTGALPAQPGIMVLSGTTNAAIPLGACSIYLDPVSLFQLAQYSTSPLGQATVNLTIPTNPLLDCLPLRVQCASLNTTTGGVELSHALHFVLGY